MNLSDFVRHEGFDEITSTLKTLLKGEIDKLVAVSKTAEVESVKYQAGIIEGIQRSLHTIERIGKDNKKPIR